MTSKTGSGKYHGFVIEGTTLDDIANKIKEMDDIEMSEYDFEKVDKGPGRPPVFNKSLPRSIRIPETLWDKIPGNRPKYICQAIEKSLESDKELEELRKTVYLMYNSLDRPDEIHRLYWSLSNPPSVK